MFIFLFNTMIKIRKKIIKIGNSYYVRIPKAFIKEGLLNEGKKYRITIEETSERPNLEIYKTDLNNEDILNELRQANEDEIEKILEKKFLQT